MLINQTLDTNFGAPHSSYQSQKQPLLSPVSFKKQIVSSFCGLGSTEVKANANTTEKKLLKPRPILLQKIGVTKMNFMWIF